MSRRPSKMTKELFYIAWGEADLKVAKRHIVLEERDLAIFQLEKAIQAFTQAICYLRRNRDPERDTPRSDQAA